MVLFEQRVEAQLDAAAPVLVRTPTLESQEPLSILMMFVACGDCPAPVACAFNGGCSKGLPTG